ncbi:integrase core domain-containing protein [Aeromonas caviae]|uniref:integrase core domain-containing protein n=1 Tax=Aeromonas caviae TaxID=648 RepID=UPI00355AFDF7
MFGESRRCLPSKLSFCSQNPWPHTFRKWCSQIPESLFNFTGIRKSLNELQAFATNWLWTYNHERPNMALGGYTPKQCLMQAA